jgi:hypothetical protein
MIQNTHTTTATRPTVLQALSRRDFPIAALSWIDGHELKAFIAVASGMAIGGERGGWGRGRGIEILDLPEVNPNFQIVSKVRTELSLDVHLILR